MSGLRSVGNFWKEIYRTYIVDQPSHFAASLSYYSLFSLIPIIYIAFRFAGIFIDNEAAVQRMFAELENVLGGDVAELLKQAMEHFTMEPSGSSVLDRMVSTLAMLFGASLVFFKLQYALNTIWRIPPSNKGQTKTFVLNRLLSFLMVFCVGVLVIVIAQFSILISFFDSLFQYRLSIPFLNLGILLIVGTSAITLVYKLLPNARVRWTDALVGAGVTAILLSFGTQVLGWYIAKGNVGSAFEAAGTIAILIVAIYFLSQFFIFGIVFTRVFADFYGGGIHPRKPARS